MVNRLHLTFSNFTLTCIWNDVSDEVDKKEQIIRKKIDLAWFHRVRMVSKKQFDTSQYDKLCRKFREKYHLEFEGTYLYDIQQGNHTIVRIL